MKKQTSKTGTGDIRIIGGQWRGRKLKVHNKEGLRPTTDRVKETVFNWLMTYTRDAKVLDCFSGAGSLGFEAASRGAKNVVCIEKDKQAAQQLKTNCSALNASEQISVRQGDFFRVSNELNEQFDLIFIDPPFHKNLLTPALETIIKNNLLSPDGLLYVEQEVQTDLDLTKAISSTRFELLKEKTMGQVRSQLWQQQKD